MNSPKFTNPLNATTNNSEITIIEKKIIGILLVILGLLISSFFVYIYIQRVSAKYDSIVVKTKKRGLFILRTNGSVDTKSILPKDLGSQPEGWSSEPEWSPDGQWIASTFDSQIYIMQADGSHRVLVPTLGESLPPTWSPDGRQIAYSYKIKSYTSPSKQGIAVTDVACLLRGETCTPKSRILQQFNNGIGYLDWSPDGEKIVYAGTSSDGYRNPIFIIDVYGQNQPIEFSSVEEHDPSWSPDGTKILSVCDKTVNHQVIEHICITNRDGSNRTYIELQSNLRYPSDIKWSPDGRKIVFIAEIPTFVSMGITLLCWTCPQPEALFIMNSDGSNLTRLTFDYRDRIDWTAWYP